MICHIFKGGKMKYITTIFAGLLLPGMATAAPDQTPAAEEFMQPTQFIAANTHIITRDDIVKIQPTNVIELLRSVPGLQMVSTGGWGAAQGMFLQGGAEKQIQININGQRIGNAINGTSPIEYLDPQQIQRIEVATGAANANRGSSALAGTINIITLKASGKKSIKLASQIGNHQTQSYSGQYQGHLNKTDYLVNARFLDRIGPDFSQKQDETNGDKDAFRDTSYLFNIQHALSENQSLELSANQNQGHTEEDLNGASPERHFRNRAFSASWKADLTDYWSTQLSLANSKDWQRTLQQNAISSSARNSIKWNSQLRPFEGLAFDFGSHWQQERTATNGTSFFDLAIPKRRTGTTNFIQQTISSTDQQIQFGFQHHNVKGTSAEVTHNLAYQHQFSNWLVTASYYTAFNPPSLVEQASANLFSGGVIDSEKSKNYQVLLQGNIAGWSIQPKLFKNKYTATSGVKSEVYGLETYFSGQLKQIDLHGSFTLQDPENKTSNKQLSNQASYFANLAADYRWGKVLIGGDVFVEGSRYTNAENSNKLDALATVNLRSNYQYSKDILLGVKIENVFDESYSTFSDSNNVNFHNEPFGIYLSADLTLGL